MALFRRLFYRKPPERLLEITERVYVFDSCFSSKLMKEDEYRDYTHGIVAQLQSYFPEASFMVFNFKEGEQKSQISEVLLPYDITVMNYPQQYVGCPVLPFEIVHQFLKACDSWLSLGRQQNVLLMHCDRAGWPVLAFMLAGLLLYKKQYTEEQRTLDMVYAQAPRELFHLVSRLDPRSSHLRYLRYISRQDTDLEEPLQDVPFTLTCLVLRVVPNFDGEGGCRPFLRIYGQDPLMPFDRSPKLLFSTFRTKEEVLPFRQADNSVIKLDVHCCVKGDVVLECIHMDGDLEEEVIMFRVMFNTSFIQSNILPLDHEEIDVLWETKEQFVKQFKAEVLFSEFDAGFNAIAEPVFIDDNETECDSAEEFFEAEEIFSIPELSDGLTDPDVQMVPITSSLEDGCCTAVSDYSDFEAEKNILGFSRSDQVLDIISSSQQLAIMNRVSLMPEILTEKVLEVVDSRNFKDNKSFDGEKDTALKKKVMKNGCNSLVGEESMLEQGAVEILYKLVGDLATSNTCETKQVTKDIVNTISSDYSAHDLNMAIADEVESKLSYRASKHDIETDSKEMKGIHDDMNSKFKISNLAGGIGCKLEIDDCRRDGPIVVVEGKSKLQPGNIKLDRKDILAGEEIQGVFFKQRMQDEFVLTTSDSMRCKLVTPMLADEEDTESKTTSTQGSENGFPKKDCIQDGMGSNPGISDVADEMNHKLETDDCRRDVVSNTTHDTEVPLVCCQAQECNILDAMHAKLEISESKNVENVTIQNSAVPDVLNQTTESGGSPSPCIVSSTKLETFSTSASSCICHTCPLLETKSIPKAPPPPPLFFSTPLSTALHSISLHPPPQVSVILDLPARPPLPPLVRAISSPPPPPLHSTSSIKAVPPPPPPPPPWPPPQLLPSSSHIAIIPVAPSVPPPIHEPPSHPHFSRQLQGTSGKNPSPFPPAPLHPMSSAQVSSSPGQTAHSEALLKVRKPPPSHLICNKSDDPLLPLPLEHQDGIPQGPSPPLPYGDSITGSFSLTQSHPPQLYPLKSEISVEIPPLPYHLPAMDALTMTRVVELAIPSPPLPLMHVEFPVSFESPPSYGIPPKPPPLPSSSKARGLPTTPLRSPGTPSRLDHAASKPIPIATSSPSPLPIPHLAFGDSPLSSLSREFMVAAPLHPSPPLPTHTPGRDQSSLLSVGVTPPPPLSLSSTEVPPPPPPPPLPSHLLRDTPLPPPLKEVPHPLPLSRGYGDVLPPTPPLLFGVHTGIPPQPLLPKEHQKPLPPLAPPLPFSSGYKGVLSLPPFEGHIGAPPPPPPPPGGLGGAQPPLAPPPPFSNGYKGVLTPPPFEGHVGAPPPPPPPGGLGGARPPPPGGCRGAPPLSPFLVGQGRAPPPPPLPRGHGGGPPLPPPPMVTSVGPPPPPPGRGGGPPAPPRVPGAPPRLQTGLASNSLAGGGRGHGFTCSTGPGMSASSSRKSSLKPLHWVKVSRAMQGSLWAELQKNAYDHSYPEFDVSELETLFSVVVKKPNKSKSEENLKSMSKSDKVNLVDVNRAKNTEIMLTKIKMPLPDMMSAVLALDDSVLDADQIENLIKFCPMKEEIELLTAYTGDKEKLGKCEQFFLELMKVPRVESKLRAFSFKIQFGAQVTDTRKNLHTVNSACEEIRNSDKLKEIMKRILFLGNTLNQGTARGSAVGFRLDGLLKLADTRATNNKMTLMHYLCKVLAATSPVLLDFHSDLINLEASSKIQLKSLAEEQQTIVKGLEKVELELSASERDGPVSEVFRKTLTEFIAVAGAEGRSITTLCNTVVKNADALAIYFGEDPARCPFEQVVNTILNFVRMFRRAHEENCKEAELKKKKAQKEAEMEKSKEGSPMKKIAR